MRSSVSGGGSTIRRPRRSSITASTIGAPFSVDAAALAATAMADLRSVRRKGWLVKLQDMLSARRWPFGIVVQRAHGRPNLFRKKAGDHLRDKLADAPAEPWIPEQSQMHGRAQLIVDAAALLNPVEVLWGEGVATGDLASGHRRLEQPPPFVLG